ncbi:putative mitochondrial-processing peptidase subunit beta, mitochondrial [Gracilariopsis chorda]|uniref:mitochondrial processing peptidase n=1 Tax=Gracilariopsis chorda TaxID=448386 RepID=A0A2V3J2M8_9FLOR|nr:putative mitochondrial-processing peptidase subunit beta, mitochondrial [Gracilariopsis chorda]|eukprot:PXF48706.1 putative mitochondrial-processing peptidase subunit beta, mitochondrial [Gracilariopsis chorda]
MMSQVARLGALRRSLSTAPLVAPALTTPPASGLKGALKRMLGPSADPLPPDFRIDESLLPEVPTRVTTLSNGLRVATETRPVGTAVVGVWIDAGTRFEDERVNGAAHFLEHLIFKGTTNRAQRTLEVGVENIGAHLNAYTSREQTVYYARSLKHHVPDMTALLADILQNSEISDAAVDRERDVILREMEEIDQIQEEVLFDYLHGTAYQDCPLARTILGPVENIKSLTSSDLKAYIAQHYKPHRMVLAAAGEVNHDDLVQLAEKNFGSMHADSSAPTSLDLVTEKPAYLVGSDVRIRNDDMPLAHFAIAFESCGWTHPDAVSFMVLQSLMGSFDRASTTGSSSSYRLASTLSGIPNARTATTFNTTYTDTGLFGIYATAEPRELDDVVVPIMEELVRNCFKVDEAQLANAKSALKTSLLSQLDGPTGIAEEIGRQLLVYGRRIPMSEWFTRIDAVDAEAIKRVSNKYIFDREVAITAMGPIHSLPDYNFIRRRTYSNVF